MNLTGEGVGGGGKEKKKKGKGHPINLKKNNLLGHFPSLFCRHDDFFLYSFGFFIKFSTQIEG